ncbi:MAG: alpha/beta fold hydrolase [Cytophagales bacterium]
MLSYSDNGKGNALVFLHGYCESMAVWNAFDAQLSQTNRVICIDLPGYGKSKPIPHLSMESMADAVFEAINHLEIKHFVVIGHSMGGYVALALAEKHPKSIMGLCLFHSTAYPDSEEKQAQRNKTIKYLNENGVEAFIRPFVPPLFHSPNRERCKASIQKLIDIGLSTPLNVISESAAAMRDRPDRTHVLSESKFPVLFIVGKNDGAVKPEDSMAQSLLPSKSYVQILGETGHQGLFERESETIKMLEAFEHICFN